MEHERFDQQPDDRLSPVTGVGMVLPTADPIRCYEPGDDQVEAAGWSAADLDPAELVGGDETDALPDATDAPD